MMMLIGTSQSCGVSLRVIEWALLALAPWGRTLTQRECREGHGGASLLSKNRQKYILAKLLTAQCLIGSPINSSSYDCSWKLESEQLDQWSCSQKEGSWQEEFEDWNTKFELALVEFVLIMGHSERACLRQLKKNETGARLRHQGERFRLGSHPNWDLTSSPAL